MANLYLGIDPGAQGAIAVLRGRALAIHKMPDTPHELADLLRTLLAEDECFALVERITGPAIATTQRQGITVSVEKKPALYSTWKFGHNIGLLYGVLAGVGMPHDLMMAVQWKRLTSARGDKKVAHAMALRLYPATKVPKYAADAVLLADLCSRMKRGERMPGEFTQQSAAAST